MKIQGKQYYLWRAVGQDGEVVDVGLARAKRTPELNTKPYQGDLIGHRILGFVTELQIAARRLDLRISAQVAEFVI